MHSEIHKRIKVLSILIEHNHCPDQLKCSECPWPARDGDDGKPNVYYCKCTNYMRNNGWPGDITEPMDEWKKRTRPLYLKQLIQQIIEE